MIIFDEYGLSMLVPLSANAEYARLACSSMFADHGRRSDLLGFDLPSQDGICATGSFR
jgi:hypothetical protein